MKKNTDNPINEVIRALKEEENESSGNKIVKNIYAILRAYNPFQNRGRHIGWGNYYHNLTCIINFYGNKSNAEIFFGNQP